MIVHKLDRFIFEFDRTLGNEPVEPPGQVPFEHLIKIFSKMTNEEKELFISELDEPTKIKIEEMQEGGLL